MVTASGGNGVSFNIFSGQGETRFSDGRVYQGAYMDDYQHGEGRVTCVDGNTYSGMWNKGMCHGQGTNTWPNGTSY